MHPVDTEFTRCLVDHRLDRRHELVLARPALRSAQRRIGQHRYCLEPHRGRLIDKRQRITRGAEVAAADVRTVLLNNVQISGEQLPIFAEAELGVTLECRTRGAERVLLDARDAHHHGTSELLREQRRDRHDRIAGDLAAETTAAILSYEHQILRLYADIARDVGYRRRVALVGAIQEALATLPIGHGGARFHAVM
jgi:hypothetical protein